MASYNGQNDPYAQQNDTRSSQIYAQHDDNYLGPSYRPDGGTTDMPPAEKMEDGTLPTQRAQPGRQGLSGAPKSWAEMGPPPRSTGILRMWRKDERGPQWTKGGGVRSTGRMICCCVTLSLVTAISIILAILLYVRPPNVALNSVSLGSSPVALTSSGLTVSFDLSITVSNPNWFNVDFKEIKATARYPGNNTTPFGGGTLLNANFKGYAASTFDFPFTLNYTTAADPNRVILNDLISKCGIDGGTKQDITVDYDLDLKLKVLGITVDPSVSSSASFLCPITAQDIQGIVGSTES